MKVKDLINVKGIIALNEANRNLEISNFYIGDMLSWIAGHIKKEKTALLTINNSYNVIAIASLLDISTIVFCDNVVPKEELIYKANEEGISLFSYQYSSFELAKELCKIEI